MYALRTIKNRTILTPTYIFQMGKVGSMSLKSTLSEYLKGEVVHSHSYGRMKTRHQKLLTVRKNLHLPIDVICPIREPISRNVSAFFQNFKKYTESDFSQHEWEVTKLLSLFLNNFCHNTCLEWFDHHFRPTFDIDVFAEPFPIERKWNIYRQHSTRALIYRSDLDKEKQLEIISRFLGIKISTWKYDNISENKKYSQIYRDFCLSAKLPDTYIKLMNDSSFCQHFWSEEERRQNSQKWLDLCSSHP